MIVLEETGVSVGEGGGEGMMGRQQRGRVVLRGGVAVGVDPGYVRERVCVRVCGGDRQESESPRCTPRSNR